MPTESVESRRVAENAASGAGHRTTLVEQRSFVVCECTCGWHSYARRSRPLARREGLDHERLHAPVA